MLLTDVLRHRYGFDDPQDKIVGYFDRFVTEAEHKLVLAADESARKAAREALDKAERNLRIAQAAAKESMPSAAALDSAVGPAGQRAGWPVRGGGVVVDLRRRPRPGGAGCVH